MSNSQDNNDLPDNEYEGEDIANESTQAEQETEVVAELVDSDSEAVSYTHLTLPTKA